MQIFVSFFSFFFSFFFFFRYVLPIWIVHRRRHQRRANELHGLRPRPLLRWHQCRQGVRRRQYLCARGIEHVRDVRRRFLHRGWRERDHTVDLHQMQGRHQVPYRVEQSDKLPARFIQHSG